MRPCIPSPTLVTHRISDAFRSLRRSPGYVALTVPLLALSLGVATAVFALVNSVLHPAIALQGVDQLYTVVSRGTSANRRVTQFESIAALRDRSSTTSDVALSEYQRVVVESGSSVEQLAVGRVSGNYFTLLGVRPAFGRLFSTATVGTDAGMGAVISFGLWRVGDTVFLSLTSSRSRSRCL